MKKLALLAAAAAALMASPAAAGGYVGAVYGNTDADGLDGDTWQAEGAVGHNAGGWGFQVDGSIGNTDAGADVDHYGLAGHLYWGGSNWRLGAVVTGASLDGGATDVDEIAYGIEGTYNVGPNSRFNAAATFGEIEILGVDADTWNLDVGFDFYANPNLRFGGTLGAGNLEAVGTDFETWTGGLDAEWAPFAAPVSFTLGWTHFDLDDAFLGGIESDNVSVGVRWNFGGSLQDRDNATPFDTRNQFYPRVFDLR